MTSTAISRGPRVIRERAAYDSYGKPRTGPDAKLEVDTWRVQVLTMQNQRVDSQALAEFRLFCDPDQDIEESDSIHFDGRRFQIKKFYKARDGFGNVHHLEIDI